MKEIKRVKQENKYDVKEIINKDVEYIHREGDVDQNINFDDYLFVSLIKKLLVILFFAIFVIVLYMLGNSINISSNNKKEEVEEKIETEKGVTYYKDDYVIKVKYIRNYKIIGKVVTKKAFYNTGLLTQISPYDFGIVTGILMRDENLGKMDFRAGNRYLQTYILDSSLYENIDLNTIYENITNNHLIPCNDNVLEKMSKVKVGDKITIQGKLINATYEDLQGNFVHEFSTSTTRKDIDCEIIYVTNIE